MCDNNGKPFIAALYNVLLAPELCNQLFFIITLMNLVHTWIFHKGFCAFFFSENKKNAVTLPHSSQRKHELLVKTKEKSKSQKQIPKNTVSLELLHHRLGHISTRLLLARDTANFWQDIEIRVDPDPFFTSFQISTINEKYGSNPPLKAKTPFKWMFMGIIPATSSKSLTKDTTFSN